MMSEELRAEPLTFCGGETGTAEGRESEIALN